MAVKKILSKAKKQECCCELCGDEKQKSEVIKVYFCPKCRSKDVGYIFGLRNVFGIIPKMKCKKCGFEAMIFPILVVDKRKLNKTKSKKKT
jgi:predicted Zn-ribbon and HTH transcriptional regulator